ncbi:hypothetical protein DPMN_179377 [Dreissena polymorpha]|uniref:Uncharacterized protein n=1 Tax=Dreissena polymorpha TaxID=45954 RepID=A0A9D4EEM7_DREPO|nr:hypothetical protein DPMN_179377 [Dreissena polymorpha]
MCVRSAPCSSHRPDSIIRPCLRSCALPSQGPPPKMAFPRRVDARISAPGKHRKRSLLEQGLALQKCL